MTSEFTSVRVRREDADTLRRLAFARSASTGERVSITEAVSLVIEAARSTLPELKSERRHRQ